MAGAFDDLIPAQSAQPPKGFDDLIPQGDASQWGPAMEGANAAMFGMGPKINQWMTDHLPASVVGQPVNADQQQASATAWEQQNPKASMAANLVGGSIPFAAAGAATGGAGWLPEMAAQAGVGAAGNSLLPMSNGQDPTSAALGGALSGAGGKVVGDVAGSTVGALAKRLAGAFKPEVNVPTPDAVMGAKNGAYQAADDANVMTSPQGNQTLADALQKVMAGRYSPSAHPGGDLVLKNIDQLNSGTPQTLTGLDMQRQDLGTLANSGRNGADLARQLRSVYDDFNNSPPPGSFLNTDAETGAGVDALNSARSLNTIARKNATADEMLERGQDNAAASGSGGNMNNTQAQAAKKLKWGSQGNWTPDEQDAQQDMINGAPGWLRAVSKMDPSSHGLGMALTAGSALAEGVPLLALGHPGAAMGAVGATLTPAFAGMAAKRLATAMGNSKEQILRDTILNGGVNPYADSSAQSAISSATPNLKRGIGGLLAAVPNAAALNNAQQQ